MGVRTTARRRYISSRVSAPILTIVFARDVTGAGFKVRRVSASVFSTRDTRSRMLRGFLQGGRVSFLRAPFAGMETDDNGLEIERRAKTSRASPDTPGRDIDGDALPGDISLITW